MAVARTDVAVLIVGGGPVGLTARALACALDRSTDKSVSVTPFLSRITRRPRWWGQSADPGQPSDWRLPRRIGWNPS